MANIVHLPLIWMLCVFTSCFSGEMFYLPCSVMDIFLANYFQPLNIALCDLYSLFVDAADMNTLFCWNISCFPLEYYCPNGAKIDRDGLRCYWMPTFKSTWLEAKGICQTEERGDLAMVDSVTVQTFIQNSFQL